MSDVNAIAGWVGMLLGVVSGAVVGMWFHEEHWLGGYGSWRRRMLRLGHIAFFGIGILNVLYAVTVARLGWDVRWPVGSWGLAAAGVLMPGVCFLTAWRKPLRHLFVVPVICVVMGIGGLLIGRIFT
jgi:hypothetical protein